jgi:hypothetical protein
MFRANEPDPRRMGFKLEADRDGAAVVARALAAR